MKEFLEEAFAHVGLDWQEYVKIDSRYFRPTEVECLLGDPARARDKLKWQARVTFKELARLMVEADLQGLLEMRQCQDIVRQMARENLLGSAKGNLTKLL